jgi:hypothetical protein
VILNYDSSSRWEATTTRRGHAHRSPGVREKYNSNTVLLFIPTLDLGRSAAILFQNR